MISKSHYPSSQNYTFSSNKSHFNTKFFQVNDVIFDTKFSQVGAIVEANAVYKKVNGAWVKQTDIASIKTELQSGNYKSN